MSTDSLDKVEVLKLDYLAHISLDLEDIKAYQSVDFALEIVTIVCIILHLLWAIAVFNALRYTYRMRKFAHHKIDLDKLNPDFVTVKHVVGLCIYKEPQALIMDTIDSIASQPDAKVAFPILFR
ncbi:hypothetical protein WR25_10997 [Diploscapter pachys]|uniref:Uncharacterized protein n=1 Tax=Diploscapter pachys TaxID=2018661 RepID=A0A2A2LR72_9BILA|nr:hypothetical protein WR25_10997 [Diploscapter pachys]